MRLKSGVLYYVMFVIFITWIISVSILLVLRLNYVVFNKLQLENTLQDDLQSVKNIVCANPMLITQKDTLHFELKNSGISQVEIKNKEWGFFNVLKFKVHRKKESIEGLCLVAADLTKKEKTGLYMADENKYLSLCGNTVLKGICYLPRMGIKRGYIEGSTYKGKELVLGAIKTSKTTLPELDKNKQKYLLSLLKDFIPDTSCLPYGSKELNKKYVFENSFRNKTISFHSEKAITIENKTLKGNIILSSSKMIIISASSILDGIIVLAPKVLIKEGFEGNVQIFATDSILVQRRCNLGYPSVLALMSENPSNLYLHIKEKCRIDGLVILMQFTKALQKPQLIVGEKSEIYGQTYCAGTVNTKGDFYGSLYCHTFILNTPNAIYENHLLHTKIDRSKLLDYFYGINLADSGEYRLGIIKNF